MKRLVITDPAANDLGAIIDYIAAEDPLAAERVYRGIVSSVERLPSFPGLGRPGRYPETRELSVAGLPYLIVYEVGSDVVTILAVFHTSRDLAQVMHTRMHPGELPDAD